MLPTLEGLVNKAREAVVDRKMAAAGLAVLQSGQEALSAYPDPASGQPFVYREKADGFQLQSDYQLHGQPITMTFPRQTRAEP
jgi:hypothetical protein